MQQSDNHSFLQRATGTKARKQDCTIRNKQNDRCFVRLLYQGQIPEKITATYNGDFNTLKNSINACIDGLGALEESNRVLGKMSLNDYSETMPTNYLGIYAEIIVMEVSYGGLNVGGML